MKFKTLLFTLGLMIISSSLFAQNNSQLITDYLKRNASTEGLEFKDVDQLQLSSQHFSKSLDADLVYMQQSVNEILIYNAIGTFLVKNQEVSLQSHNFTSQLNEKTSNTSASLDVKEAINIAANYFQLDKNSETRIIESKTKNSYVLENNSISHEKILVKLVYQEIDNALVLAWDISIYLKNTEHWWSFRLDAHSGEIIDQNDWLLSCNFENHDHQNFSGLKQNKKTQQKESVLFGNTNLSDNAQYRAYDITIESPNHGETSLLINPANTTASPYGWHDTDGVEGAEYTITRGNNVYAHEDRAGDDSPGYSPDGGSNLNFDFPVQENQPALINEDAAITNLFVRNNMMHDLWFIYGFDEESGNFQQKNYEASAFSENDPVYADAQDGSGVNNANFGTPPDGYSPRMQMFLWATAGQPLPQINITNSSASGEYFGIEAAFGPALSTEALIANLVLAENENSLNAYEACNNLTNPAEIDGKIAVIKRGNCSFTDKVMNAQNAGAIAVIVVNNEAGQPIRMGGENTSIIIPSLMITQFDGQNIISALENNETLTTNIANNGPFKIDGDFDNGIIAHEYGHGISSRLTGGKADVNCLFNDEQMGEGWSDWIGLIMTMNDGDQGTDARGYGTFAVNQDISGSGIRPFPYSTDMSTNPATYGLTNNFQLSKPHGIGFVWATMLWDLTWEFIDVYGYDPDLYNGDGGNNKVKQLVIDGLKLQSCDPGFIDGRDAILQADQLINNGENHCLIWEVFARRGLGYSANQGSAYSRYDQTEAFDLPPSDLLNCTLNNESFNKSDFKIFPNPTQSHFEIDFGQLNFEKVNVQIYDINGREILSQEASESQRINISHLSSGVYFVKMKNGSKTTTKKLIVQ
ncbi:MAG: T9SS-dependent M36 family metallopeptidase [Psychroflexus halocasei]